MAIERTTSSRPYSLIVKTSRTSSTALWLEANCDADAVVKARRVLSRFGTFCDHPTFEMARWDGTHVEVERPIIVDEPDAPADPAPH